MLKPALTLSNQMWAMLVGFLISLPAHAEIVETDVCVYGATSSGVSAAVEVAQQGKSVVLLSFNQHIGGLTTGGLGATDIGNKDVIGGLSRQFYQRVAKHYAQDAAWKWETREHFFSNRSKRTKLNEVLGDEATMWTFEPHVASKVFKEMLTESAVPVRLDQRLSSVKKDSRRIQQIQMENGDVFRARVFIDATYEGDLMAMTGVSYRVGREANSTYGETLNGIRDQTRKNEIHGSVDPFVSRGDPASGLIPLIQTGNGGIPGDGDQRVQAYNFRLCFTNIPENRLDLSPPANYDPALYELAARRVEVIVSAGNEPHLKQFCNPVWMPNGKTDINNGEGISTDYIGQNYDYPDGDYQKRAEIWNAHEDYVRGFWYFMSTCPRVPEKLRNEFKSFGPCKDEFLDTEGWSPQLYVREARRMVSNYVMTEHNCRSKEIASDSVGMAAYGMDSHNCQRIVKNGAAQNEGDVQKHGLKPYPISYRSIVPKATECENLLVPVCVSATHIAFGSIRMEPVFMVLGQSAGTAAALASEKESSVQALDYKLLRKHLLARGQVLERPKKASSTRFTGKHSNSSIKSPKIVCFGDSITKRGYPEQLATILEVEVGNAGIAGDTTRRALRRLERDVLKHDPEVVVLCFGTNDSRLAEKDIHVPVDEFASNITEMIESCRTAKCEVLLCTVPPINNELYFQRHAREKFDEAGGLDKVLRDYRETAIKVGRATRTPIVDLSRLLTKRSGWQHTDGLHPSKEGNQIIASYVAEKARQLLEAEEQQEVKPDTVVRYKTVGKVKLSLHMFKPPDHSPSDSRPTIVFFFGGGWNGGSITQFYPQSEYLASRGMVAICANYRVKSRHQTSPRECVKDGKSAIRWIRAHAQEIGINPNMIAAGGGSAGGHVAAAAAVTRGFENDNEDISISSRPNALVLFNPVFDNGPTGFGYDRVKEYWQNFSPLHNIDESAPPTIVFLGTNDKLIPVATAEQYLRRMREVGVRCELKLYDGQRHGFFNKPKAKYIDTLIETDRFLTSLGYLQGEPTLSKPGNTRPRR